MKKKIITVFLLSFLSAQSYFNKVGTVGALFLTIPTGAGSQGFGRAYSGVASGAVATFWNPATLGFERELSLFTGYTQWLMGLHHQASAVSFRFRRLTVGFSQKLLTTAPMTMTTTREPRGTGKTFRYLDLAVGVSVAKAFSDRFALGSTLRYVQESVSDIQARGFSVDIGSYYKLGYKDLRMFMVLKNFGPDLKFGGTFLDTRVKGNVKEEVELEYGAFSLPLIFVFGMAGTVWQNEQHSFIGAVEAAHPSDYSQRLNLGGEFNWNSMLKIRGGYKLNYEQESWTVGFGYAIGKILLDVAYSAMNDFSGVTSYSIQYSVD